jgi:hypothetical protein
MLRSIVTATSGPGTITERKRGDIQASLGRFALSFVLAAALLLIGMVTAWLVVRRPLQPAELGEAARA